ncbi:hypothetical protein NEHOM01_0095 [Nematocida homosporus]|uniref:uncharacterized protein n=1 Tax=Nematocida homosporus TaxID=1912981 RepID=UPI00221FDF61|nr:uncharacterized protein NEHOM01_0095 [Nematocida homosporus]KAI5184350.1 hypothetical protein NEHOM01_0095 [Nematocida homosporus]
MHWRRVLVGWLALEVVYVMALAKYQDTSEFDRKIKCMQKLIGGLSAHKLRSTRLKELADALKVRVEECMSIESIIDRNRCLKKYSKSPILSRRSAAKKDSTGGRKKRSSLDENQEDNQTLSDTDSPYSQKQADSPRSSRTRRSVDSDLEETSDAIVEDEYTDTGDKTYSDDQFSEPSGPPRTFRRSEYRPSGKDRAVKKRYRRPSSYRNEESTDDDDYIYSEARSRK